MIKTRPMERFAPAFKLNWLSVCGTDRRRACRRKQSHEQQTEARVQQRSGRPHRDRPSSRGAGEDEPPQDRERYKRALFCSVRGFSSQPALASVSLRRSSAPAAGTPSSEAYLRTGDGHRRDRDHRGPTQRPRRERVAAAADRVNVQARSRKRKSASGPRSSESAPKSSSIHHSAFKPGRQRTGGRGERTYRSISPRQEPAPRRRSGAHRGCA